MKSDSYYNLIVRLGEKKIKNEEHKIRKNRK